MNHSDENLRAEHASVAEYLESVLTPEQRQSVLLTSFNQWQFSQSALADTALCLQDMGSQISIAMWADHTPVHDVGWTTSRAISSIFRSPARDQRIAKALMTHGVSTSDIIDPPIKNWKPAEPIDIPAHLNRTNIRAMTYRGTAVGRAILQVHPDRETPITDDHLWPRRWVTRNTRSYAYVYDQVLAAIDQRGITVLVSYNGRFLHDRAAVAAAETRGIPVLNYDTGGLQTDFDLTIDATHDWSALQRRMLAMYENWPADERDELGSSWFLERINHEDPVNAEFTDGQVRGASLDLTPDTTTVVYFSSSGDEIAELELDWDAYFAGQPNALLTLADICRSKPGYELIVRSHPHKRRKPKRDVADWLEAVEAANPDVHLDPFSEIDSYELMRQADVIVTYGSTTGVEAAFANKPVIVMGPCAYDELGCAQPVATKAELAAALDARDTGWWPGAVSYGLMMKRRGFTYKYVTRTPEGGRALGGTTFDEPSQIVLNLSHAMNRLQRWWLTRS